MQYLKYSDIDLIPNYSELYSRVDADTSVDFCGKQFKLPIIPANMKSVINMNVAKWMSDQGYFYIMHRFGGSLLDTVSQMNQDNWDTISVSMGVKMSDKKDLVNISKSKYRVDYITVDIAHGHCERMRIAIKAIKKFLPDSKIIAGNVCTSRAVKDLYEWGADAVKVGIGQGSPCTTKYKTGFTMPMFSCVQHCSNHYAEKSSGFLSHSIRDEGTQLIPIIADGGIKHNGDIAKALTAGATMVMAGGLFAACSDSPAETSIINSIPHKAYFGSASIENKGHANNVEGKLTNLSFNNMTYESKLLEITQDLQSSISYAGGKSLEAFEEVNYIEV